MTLTLHRRSFLATLAGAAALPPLTRFARADEVRFAPVPGATRSFETITRIELASVKGAARAWVPVPSSDLDGWFAIRENTFRSNTPNARLRRDSNSGAAFVEASWEGDGPAALEVVSRFTTRDRAVAATQRGSANALTEADRALFLKPSKFVPTNGIVKEVSDRVTQGSSSDVDKLRALYEWVVDNTYRDGATRGCGTGDIVAMLNSGKMGGKCADINALMVGLTRAAGIPAREIYGVRVAPSQFGYKSLGANAAVISKAQHCRAEAWLEGIGWFPVDPADVRKVALEEPPGNIAMTNEKVVAARKALFGSWETNWVPYNTAEDVQLSTSSNETLPFLMYPQAEVGGVKLDCLEPDSFRYSITARELDT